MSIKAIQWGMHLREDRLDTLLILESIYRVCICSVRLENQIFTRRATR